MSEVARVVLGIEVPQIAEEVMHFLDRTERVRVVGAASDDQQLDAAVRQLEPDMVMATPSLLGRGAPGRAPVVAVDIEETVGGLRAALRVGARGFYVWPRDRGALATAAARTAADAGGHGADTGRVIGITGARGGAGASFVAANVAAAIARMQTRCVLVDADAAFADLRPVLGVPLEPAPRSIAELAVVADELSATHLQEVLWTHPAGFPVLLAPPEPAAGDGYREAIRALTRLFDVVVVHLPRTMDTKMRALAVRADVLVVVLGLDVASFHGAKRLITDLDPDRLRFVIDRATRSEIVPSDVERVLGRSACAVIPIDRTVPGLQDRGRLASPRGRAGREIARLAAALLEVAS